MKALIKLFLHMLAVVFSAFVILNVIVVVSDNSFKEFNLLIAEILQLPYLLYLALSIIISIIFVWRITRKTK